MNHLQPSNLIEIPEYNDWNKVKKITVSNNIHIDSLEGIVNHTGYKSSSKLYKLLKIATTNEIELIRNLIKTSTFDNDPDSVDGMSTYELYVESPNIDKHSINNMKFDNLDSRKKLRKQLRKIMNPIIKNRITPYVRKLYSKSNNPDRLCTPYSSFIRRYNKNERLHHATHRDGHAFATVVISLSDYGKEYRGGLYVASEERYKKIVPLNRGDAVVHQFDLLHGVKVHNSGERWSWIIWYRDSINCKDYSNEWFRDQAYQGNPLYQGLYANVVSGDERILWHQKAAEQGYSNSMVKLARAYLHLLPSNLEFNSKKAEELYKNAIQRTQDPHAQYGLAQMLLSGLIKLENKSTVEVLREVILLLEESAKGGHVFAMFNLGIAHLYGYSGVQNIKLAKEWFEITNLPEGLIAASMYYDSIGEMKKVKYFKDRAYKMGYDSIWRKKVRNNVGLGGAGGVDINLPWPELPKGIKPPLW